jgi:hypothetical protein
MSQPGTYPAPRTVASRVLEVVRDELQPAFATALVRATSDVLHLDVTDDELDTVTRALPDAAAGRPVGELDVAVAELVAEARADATYRDTVAGLSGRAGARPAASAVRVGRRGAGSGRPSLAAAGLTSSGSCEPCAAVAGTALDLPDLAEPAALISADYVTAAGVLAVVYQYGDRIGFFDAVDRAIHALDGDELCIADNEDLQNRLYCYDERDNRVTAPERARLAATVLGLRDPDLPDGVRPDPVIPGLLNQLLDAINDNCDPGVFRDEPTPTDAFLLESAARAVQVRLSVSVTGLSALRIRDLQRQFGVAQEILRDIAPFVRPLCRPAGAVPAQQGLTGVADEWVSVAALLGPQLADGTDLFDAARTARAWRTVFDWLIDSVEPVDSVVPLPTEVCEAAAILRPTQGRHCRSGCTR